MMRKYGTVEGAYWAWARKCGLSVEATMLGAYLMTNEHSNSVGCYRLPNGFIAEDLPFDAETISKGFAELSRNRFAYRCERTNWVFIRDYLDHNPPANPNVGKKMASIVRTVPRDFTYWIDFKDALKPYAERFPKGFINGLANGIANRIETTNTNTNTNTTTTDAPKPLPEPSPPPKTEPKEPSSSSSVSNEARTLVDHFLAERNRLWPKSPRLPTARLTLERQAQDYLDAKAPPELAREVVTRVLGEFHAKGQPNPPSSLSCCCDSMDTAIRRHLTEIPVANRRNGAGKQQGEPTGPVIESDRQRWIRDAVAKLVKAGVSYTTAELSEHAEDDAWLQAKIAEKTDLTKRPECMVSTA